MDGFGSVTNIVGNHLSVVTTPLLALLFALVVPVVQYRDLTRTGMAQVILEQQVFHRFQTALVVGSGRNIKVILL